MKVLEKLRKGIFPKSLETDLNLEVYIHIQTLIPLLHKSQLNHTRHMYKCMYIHA